VVVGSVIAVDWALGVLVLSVNWHLPLSTP
jgi:hypothetical protein